EIRLDVTPRDIEQRAGQVAIAAAHRGKPARTAAPQQVKKQGLHLVILVVTKRDRRAAGSGRRLTEKAITRASGRAFRMRGPGIRPSGMKLVTPAGGCGGDEISVAGATRTPAMIEVRHGEMERHRR